MTSTTYSTALAALDAIVIDTETTGLDAKSARIVQIGAVRVDKGLLCLSDGYDRLVNPGIPIPPETTAIHGITDAAVEQAPKFADIAVEVQGLLTGQIVVGHTIGFDLAMFEREFKLAGRDWSAPAWLDVRLLAEIALPTLAQYDLDRLAALLGVPIEGRHTAMGDAVATAKILLALTPHLRERGIRTLADADAALRHLADRKPAAGGPTTTPKPVASDWMPALERIDSFPYRHRVGDIMSAPVAWVAPDATVREALSTLLEKKISSVLVEDPAGIPGIATERDLLRAIDKLGAAGLDAPASDHATRPVQSVSQDDFVYRAIGRVGRLGIRHLLVTDAAGRPVGMVTTRNLLRHRASTVMMLGDEIAVADTSAALAAVWSRVPLLAQRLLDEQVDSRTIASVISTELSALTRRAAEIAETRMSAAGAGPPPQLYAVLVLGSAGRGESLLAADQDNAIVYAEGEPDGPEDQWFAALGTHIADILDEAGIPYCKGGVMAKNAAWRMSEAGWRSTIDRWIRRQRPEDLLNVDIFFDAIVVHGDVSLGESVIAHAFEMARPARDFHVQLTEIARRWQMPTTLLGGFRTEADGRLDLKKHGLLPVFSAARVLAIKNGLRMRGSADRLAAANLTQKANEADLAALIEAHALFLRLMLDQQLIDARSGVRLSPRVDVKRLDAPARAALKAALGKVVIAIDMVSEGRL